MIKKGMVLTAILLMIVWGLIAYLMPSATTLISIGVAAVAAIYFLALSIKVRKLRGKGIQREPRRTPARRLAFLTILYLILPFFLSGVLIFYGIFNIILTVVLVGFTLTFFSNFLFMPLALYHKHLESKIWGGPPRHHPSLSIIVPAYNEEKCIERTIESLLEADYPKKEIIIVDDGSTDRTYEIAGRYFERGVKVLSRSHGGKWAALNYGIFFSKGEIIVTVDADSLIGKHSLTHLIRRFDDPRVKAVCGNVKVLNRGNFLTRCQALEYITAINMYRRALDVFGSVEVVPGVLGAYRREVLVGGGSFSGDTLTEDFDVTVKTLKAGSIVQASSHAYAYTEAPETLRDLYKQRLRWYRGNFQTLIRHRDAFLNPGYGFLHKLAFPYVMLSMTFFPFAGIVTMASTLMAILSGAVMEVALIFTSFVALQFLFSALAIQLDEEDIRLAVYAPFFVVGYKQLCDLIMIKSLFDVLLKRKMGWGRAKRMGARAPPRAP